RERSVAIRSATSRSPLASPRFIAISALAFTVLVQESKDLVFPYLTAAIGKAMSFLGRTSIRWINADCSTFVGVPHGRIKCLARHDAVVIGGLKEQDRCL